MVSSFHKSTYFSRALVPQIYSLGAIIAIYKFLGMKISNKKRYVYKNQRYRTSFVYEKNSIGCFTEGPERRPESQSDSAFKH
jgi:hypothetical protein